MQLSFANIAQACCMIIYGFDASFLRATTKDKQPSNDATTQSINSLTYLCSMPKIGAMYAQKKLLECI